MSNADKTYTFDGVVRPFPWPHTAEAKEILENQAVILDRINKLAQSTADLQTAVTTLTASVSNASTEIATEAAAIVTELQNEDPDHDAVEASATNILNLSKQLDTAVAAAQTSSSSSSAPPAAPPAS